MFSQVRVKPTLDRCIIYSTYISTRNTLQWYWWITIPHFLLPASLHHCLSIAHNGCFKRLWLQGQFTRGILNSTDWMSALVWRWYGCPTRPGYRSAVQSGLRNNGPDSGTEGLKEAREGSQEHKRTLPGGEITKNTLLWGWIWYSWREIFLCQSFCTQ